MIKYILVKGKKSNQYYVLENGVKVKNWIFYNKKDFENELKALGITNYTLEIKN